MDAKREGEALSVLMRAQESVIHKTLDEGVIGTVAEVQGPCEWEDAILLLMYSLLARVCVLVCTEQAEDVQRLSVWCTYRNRRRNSMSQSNI